MTTDEIARFLRTHPHFFDQHPELLESIHVPHPYGGRAIALSERQTVALREKVKLLESKLAEIIRFGEENDGISEKVHRLCCALLAAPGLESFLSSLHYNLREDFAVPNVALRMWGGRAGELIGDRAEFGAVSPETKALAASFKHPFCGPSGNAEVAGWFGEAAQHIRSVALISLREPGAAGAEGACIGLVALGSEDVMRFYPEMGTLYLRRLGELVSAGLSQFHS